MLDNVTEPQSAVRPGNRRADRAGPEAAPAGHDALAAGAAGIRWLTLGELSEAETPGSAGKAPRSSPTTASARPAHRIVRRLGGFALAVELVGAWLTVIPEVTYADFLQRLGLEELETLDELADDSDPTSNCGGTITNGGCKPCSARCWPC